MQIMNFDGTDDTAGRISSWANAKYGNAQPSLSSYAQREGGYSDPVMNATSVSMPTPVVAATPSNWAQSASAPGNSQPAWSNSAFSAAPTTSTTSIDPNQLAKRTVDASKETVAGQINGLLSANSPVLQQARADAMRSANERGMLNSAMAASGGTDAVIRSATQIATPDAATYGNAADYNTALSNQTTMWNADQKNQDSRFNAQLAADAASRAQAFEIAKLQDQTQRWQQEMQDATSRYNTDAQYRQQADNDKRSMANNIIQNMDLSPDRKAALLESLGQGTMARMENGVYVPGTGLAGAVYVIGSTSNDLNFADRGVRYGLDNAYQVFAG